jgi:hypothetical protein
MVAGVRLRPSETVRHSCERCGRTRPVRAAWQLCPDCESIDLPPQPVSRTARGGHVIECTPWQGEFDADDNPLDADGQLVLPGRRTCRHRDCVRPEHVITEKESIAA